jgi:hypothetical protein
MPIGLGTSERTIFDIFDTDANGDKKISEKNEGTLMKLMPPKYL